MFNKGKEPVARPAAGVDTDTKTAPPPPPPVKKSMPKNSAPSILSDDLEITGTVIAEGEIQLDGRVEGDVRAGSLTVGEKASVKGEVLADSVTIRGHVVGSVRGRQVTLASTARIEGDITHSALSVESGAFFEGHCRHAADPLSGGSSSKVSLTTAQTGSSSSSDTLASSPFGGGSASS